jgi:hypothetical protein
MNVLAPGWIAIAAVASVAVAAIHLIAWRQPRAVKLPTARFVPDEPARRAARTVRPADPALMALRIVILMAGGLALARPTMTPDPRGQATVIAIEAGGDTAALRDSMRAIERSDRTAFVVFDTTATVYADEAEAWSAAGREPAVASISVGLVAAIREAHRLARDHESVLLVLASSFARRHFDDATRSIRDTWQDSIRVVRMPASEQSEPAVTVETRATGDDPVVGGILLARANGLLRGAARVVRDSVMAADNAWAEAGRTLVVWPRSTVRTESVDGVHAGGFTAIGHYLRGPAVDSGRVIARWVDGTPAAFEVSRGAGCVRSIGFDVPDAGDFVLTPSFQRLLSVLVAPCGDAHAPGVVPDSLIHALVPPPAVAPQFALPDEVRAPNRLASSILLLAVLLSVVEMRVRRGRGGRNASPEQRA